MLTVPSKCEKLKHSNEQHQKKGTIISYNFMLALSYCLKLNFSFPNSQQSNFTKSMIVQEVALQMI